MGFKRWRVFFLYDYAFVKIKNQSINNWSDCDRQLTTLESSKCAAFAKINNSSENHRGQHRASERSLRRRPLVVLLNEENEFVMNESIFEK